MIIVKPFCDIVKYSTLAGPSETDPSQRLPSPISHESHCIEVDTKIFEIVILSWKS